MVRMRMGERDHAGFTPTELSGDVAGGPARAAVEEDPVHEVGVDGVDRESVQPPYARGNCFQGGAIRLRESPGPPWTTIGGRSSSECIFRVSLHPPRALRVAVSSNSAKTSVAPNLRRISSLSGEHAAPVDCGSAQHPFSNPRAARLRKIRGSFFGFPCCRTLGDFLITSSGRNGQLAAD